MSLSDSQGEDFNQYSGNDSLHFIFFFDLLIQTNGITHYHFNKSALSQVILKKLSCGCLLNPRKEVNHSDTKYTSKRLGE